MIKENLTYSNNSLVTVNKQLNKTPGKDLALIDLKMMYNTSYKPSYDLSTGKSWSETKFVNYAKNWVFYGDETAYVAVRPQKTGGYKLVSIAADPKDTDKNNKLKLALSMLLSENKPLWGLVNKPIAALAKRAGFIVLTPELVTSLFESYKGAIPIIPPNVVSGSTFVVNKDATISVDDSELGILEPKLVIANKLWFIHSIKLIKEALKYIDSRIGNSTQSLEEKKHLENTIQLLESIINITPTFEKPVKQLENVSKLNYYKSQFI